MIDGEMEYQITNLERIFSGAEFSPCFKGNSKYPLSLEGGGQRIAYGDVMNYKFIIRKDPACSMNSFWNEETEVIAEYQSITALVDDGWRLD